MKRLTAFFFTVLIHYSLAAQVKVRFVVKEQTRIHNDSIYITGSFSNWDSTPNPLYKMHSLNSSTKEIVLTLDPGRIEYKFHRGSWLTVEKASSGYEVANRVVNIKRDITIYDSVAAWRDQLIREKWLAIADASSDTTRVQLYVGLGRIYAFVNDQYQDIDSALYYSRQALLVLQTIRRQQFSSAKRYSYYLVDVQELTAQLMHSLGNYPKSLELRLENLKIAEDEKDGILISSSIQNIIDDYSAMKDYPNELKYCDLLIEASKKVLFPGTSEFLFNEWIAFIGKARAYYQMGRLDSSLQYARQSYQMAEKYGSPVGLARSGQLLADVYLATNRFDEASAQYIRAIGFAYKGYDYPSLARLYNGLARLNKRAGNRDSALFYAKTSFNILRQNHANIQSWGENTETTEADVSPLLAELYFESHQPDSAYKYLRLAADLKDSLYNVNRLRQFQNVSFNESTRRLQQVQQEKLAQQQFNTKIKFYLLMTAIVVTMVIIVLMYRNSRQKQKAHVMLQQKNTEIDRQRAKAENAYSELKATQAQLIQSEKMASLGELTAGIAHEIQNPLNFVNNFSEVSGELLEEIKWDLDRGEVNEVKAIVEDLTQNLQKIAHHGKRADAIVKSMLQHSRKTPGQKDWVDINALVDEYLRMSYHGFRAKDNSFNAILETHFDPEIKRAYVEGQDIGRVLLNLFNNAFYAVNEKKKREQNGFEPMVQVSTYKMDSIIQVRVKDNGTGIPEKVLEKIYQPFFTTKPTGEGTGLGLSLSYDIITKGHSGEMNVETREGEGSEFIIRLPNPSSL